MSDPCGHYSTHVVYARYRGQFYHLFVCTVCGDPVSARKCDGPGTDCKHPAGGVVPGSLAEDRAHREGSA